MAWDQDCDMVACACVGDCPDCPGFAKRLSDLAIGRGLAVGYGLDLFPDSPLKGRCLYVYWQVRWELSAVKVLCEFLSPLLHLTIVSAYVRGIVVLLQRGFDSLIRGTNADGAYSRPGCS